MRGRSRLAKLSDWCDSVYFHAARSRGLLGLHSAVIIAQTEFEPGEWTRKLSVRLSSRIRASLPNFHQSWYLEGAKLARSKSDIITSI